MLLIRYYKCEDQLYLHKIFYKKKGCSIVEFTATTVKKEFIHQIINDEICVPSKGMREIFNNDWQHVSMDMLYGFITESMHPMQIKIRMLTNLAKFVDEGFMKGIKAYITCHRYEYKHISKKTSHGTKFVYNVYSMKYHEDHSNRCFEEMSNYQGDCNRFIGTADSLDNARRMVILDHKEYSEDEEETHDIGYNLFYMVSKTILFTNENNDLDCSYGDIYFDKNGNIIDTFLYDFRSMDDDYDKCPTYDQIRAYGNDISKINGIDKFAKDKKVKVYNSIYTRYLCDCTERYGYIIGYLEDPISNYYATIRNSNKKTARCDYMPIQYIDIVRKDD